VRLSGARVRDRDRDKEGPASALRDAHEVAALHRDEHAEPAADAGADEDAAAVAEGPGSALDELDRVVEPLRDGGRLKAALGPAHAEVVPAHERVVLRLAPLPNSTRGALTLGMDSEGRYTTTSSPLPMLLS